jgi:hypothetical protein
MKYQITKQQVEALSRGEVITCGYMSFKASGRVQDICRAILNKNMPDFFKVIIERGGIVTNMYVVPKGMRRKRRRRV